MHQCTSALVHQPGGSLSVRTQPCAALDLVRLASEAAPPSSDRALGLRGNFIWTLAGNLVYAATQWGLLVVIAKLGAPELVGQFALGLAVCAPIFFLSRLALRPVQATDARREYQFGHYLALRIVTVPVALALVAIIVLTVDYRPEVTWVILAVAIAKAAESLSDPFYGAFQQRERMDHISKSMIAKGLLALVGFTLVFRLTGNLVWSVAAIAVAWATVLVLYDFRGASLFGFATRAVWEPRVLFALARLALPVGMAAMLLSLNTNIPRYYIERFLNERELGIYAAAAYVTVALGTAVNALGQSASPRLARFYADGDKGQFGKLLRKLLVLGVGLGIPSLVVAGLYGREILAILYGPEYGANAELLVWLMAVLILSNVAAVLGYGMTAARMFRVQPVLFAAAAAVGGLGCYVLIPAHGLVGAVWAYGAAVLVQAVGALISNLYALRQIEAHAVI